MPSSAAMARCVDVIFLSLLALSLCLWLEPGCVIIGVRRVKASSYLSALRFSRCRPHSGLCYFNYQHYLACNAPIRSWRSSPSAGMVFGDRRG